MDATRRDAVKRIGGAVLAAGAAPFLLAPRASEPGTDLRTPGGTGLHPRLADALLHASLAPSGHNAQPWAVRLVGPDRLRFGTARERWLPAVDPGNREARPRPFPLERIRRRRTVRGGHMGRPLSGEDIRALTAPFAERALFFPAGTTAARWIGEATLEAVRRQLRSYGGWHVVTSPDASIASLLDTGRRLERMLLGVRERQIAVHPMSQALEEAPLKEKASRALGVSGKVQFVLRVSYVERYPEPVSPRRPVTRFVSAMPGSRSVPECS